MGQGDGMQMVGLVNGRRGRSVGLWGRRGRGVEKDSRSGGGVRRRGKEYRVVNADKT